MTVTISGLAAGAEGVMDIVYETGYDTGTPVGGTASGAQAAAGSPFNITLSSAPAVSSDVIGGASGDTSGGASIIGVGTGFTTLFHTNDANNVDSFSEARTASTSTTVGWTSTSAGVLVGAAIEIRAAAGGGFAVPQQQFKVDKFRTPFRSMGPKAGLFQVKAFPIAVASDTPAPYVSRPFSPQQWNLNTPLLRGTAQDTSSSGIETNPHWRGRAWAAQWSPLRALMQNSDSNVPFAQSETNTFFTPRTWPMQWTTRLQNSVTDVPAPPAVDTPAYVRFRTFPVQWSLNLALGQNTAQDFSASDVETNPYWQGRVWPVVWTPTVPNRVPAVDVPAPPAVETNTYFIPRTWSVQWTLTAGLLRGTPQDLSTVVVVTQAQYIMSMSQFFNPGSVPIG